MADVTVILVGEGAADVDSATGTQEVEDVLVSPSLGGLKDVLSAARTPLVWLLHRAASPNGSTLSRLLEDASHPAASLPLSSTGLPLDRLLGRFTEWDVEGILEAAEFRRVPLRHTHIISLLVETEFARGLAPPSAARYGRYAGVEWTGRMFALKRGMLVPASTVTIDPRAVAGSIGDAVRTARSGVWGRGEALREIASGVRSG
jgi:hypothetical protein